MALALIFYGSFAALAMWGTYRDRDLMWIGVWLVGGYVFSNYLFFNAPVSVRPGPYTFIEIMVAVAAFCAWSIHRHHSKREAYGLIGIVILNLLSISANIAFAANFPPTARQIFAFEVTTNIIFAAECLFAFGVGLLHGLRVGHFRRGPVASWVAAKLHVARAPGDAG